MFATISQRCLPIVTTFLALLALVAAGLAPASAQTENETQAAMCSAEGAKSPDEMIGICGLVIDSVAAAPADRIQALLARAELRRKGERFDLAVQDCSEAIRLDPAPRAFDCRGNALAADKKYLAALDDFDRAIKLDPKYVQAFADRAATFGLMRETRLAVRDYTEAVRLAPDRVQGFVDRAEAHLKVRRIDLAIDDQSEAIRLEPSSSDHFDARGKLYARNNAYDRAIADFNEAIRLQPKADYLVERGNAWNLKGNPDRAIADYDEAIRLDPALALAYNNRGVAWRDKGDTTRARADFQTALTMDPTLDIAAEHLARLKSQGAQTAKRTVPLHPLANAAASLPK
jgi:tetratricopeptide (TPR) repeat protein